MKTRREKDSLGEKEIPESLYYGIHTTRSIENFPISGLKVPAEIIQAIALLKLSCAKANEKQKKLAKNKADSIVKATREVIGYKFSDQFPIDIFQAGSGTSTNMNVNEVIANRANELSGGKKGDKKLIHPNDHVNMGQSTNNIFPASIRVASILLLEKLFDHLRLYIKALKEKGKEFDHIVKSGRTHLQDAVPIRLGQVFSAFAYSAEKDLKKIQEAAKYVKELGAGGNAVGTGINTKKGFRDLIIKYLNKEIKKKFFSVTGNGIEATHTITDLSHLSAALRSLAIDAGRVCNDLRLMSSGPNTGINEIDLPPVEPGSSIMPGKINPSICEAVNMACYKVIGNDSTVTCCANAGQFELNVTMPVTGYCLIETIKILTGAIEVLTNKCIKGIEANETVCKKYLEASPSLATFLNPVLGYDKASEIVKSAIKKGRTIKEELLKEKIMTEEEVDRIFNPVCLTSPKP